VGPYIHIDQHTKLRLAIRRGTSKFIHDLFIVYTNDHICPACEVHQSPNLGSVRNFIRQQYAAHAMVDEALSLSECRAGHADRPCRELPRGKVRALMVLEMRAEFGGYTAKERGHPLKVGLHAR
jgi:hypothetical protein